MTDAQINQALRTGEITGEMLPYIFANAEWAVWLGPYVFWGFAAALVVAEAVEFFLAEFTGRPKMAATIDEAKVLKHYSSPVMQFLALGAADLVNRGIPVSSPDAASHFGPYFVAAQKIENAIRFGNQTAGSQNLTNATLTQALHESGNPGTAGSATLQALQSAWNQFAAGHAIPGRPAYDAVKALGQQGGGDPASAMSRSWAQTYISHNPGQFAAQTGTGGGGAGDHGKGTPGIIPTAYLQALGNIVQNAPPGREILYQGKFTGKYAASWYNPGNVLLNSVFPGLQLGQLVTGQTGSGTTTVRMGGQVSQVLHGEVVFTAQLEGGPYPNAHAEWRIDGQMVCQTAAESTTATEVITVGCQWNSKTVVDGNHNLDLKWVGHLGTVHADQHMTIRVQNQPANGHQGDGQQKHQCPPGYAWNPKTESCQPLPPVPIPLPWDVWFDPCRETPKCDNLGNDTIAVVQSIANVAAALNQIFRSQQSETIDPCCHAIVLALGNINTQLLHLVQHFTPQHDVASLINPLDNIVHAISSLATGLEKAIKAATGGDDTVTPAVQKELDCVCKQLTRIADIMHQDVKPPTQPMKIMRLVVKHLADMGALDSGTVQLLDSFIG